MSTLLVEPFGGWAGDMFLAALLDLEHPALAFDDLARFVESLVPGECRLRTDEVKRGSLRGRVLHVETEESADPPERHLAELLALVEGCGLGAAGRARAAAVFTCIARAEAEVHASTLERVHFHEVGAVDTLVDVCGALFALEALGVERIWSRPPYVGGGVVHCAHGEMPVPAPGTAAILAGPPARPWVPGTGGERLTPTGAALYATLTETLEDESQASGGLGAWRSAAVGYGAGTRDPAQGPPNLMRVQLGEVAGTGAGESEQVLLLAFNLDDATPEEVGFLVGALREAGALEVWSSPLFMKKDRPGVLVSALVHEDGRAALERVAFHHSPTLGVRWSRWERTVCARETVEVSLAGSVVRVKLRRRPGGKALQRADVSPEYDDLARLARESGLPLRELEARAVDLVLAERS